MIVVDYAHNEAGIEGLLEVCRGLAAAGPRVVWITIAAAGDRSDAILHGLGLIAARRADHVGIAELLRYLRGRDREELIQRMRAGAFDGGARRWTSTTDELSRCRRSSNDRRPGDVVAVTALGCGPRSSPGWTRPVRSVPRPKRVLALAAPRPGGVVKGRSSDNEDDGEARRRPEAGSCATPRRSAMTIAGAVLILARRGAPRPARPGTAGDHRRAGHPRDPVRVGPAGAGEGKAKAKQAGTKRPARVFSRKKRA